MQSAYVSVTTAILVVALAYPFVLAIVYLVPERLQRLVLLLAIAPFWTSYILRVFAWQTLLAKRGVFNTAMQTLGLDGLAAGHPQHADRDTHRPDPLRGADHHRHPLRHDRRHRLRR